MKHYHIIVCPFCGSEDLVKHGHNSSGVQHFSQSGEKLEIAVKFSGEMDEFWSFVQSNSNQRWTWYAIEIKSVCILARHNGKRSDRDFLILWKMLKEFNIDCCYTDNCGSYSKYIPPGRHRIGKYNTWKIERKNLNFRTHLKRLNRKTICFSKNETIHGQRYRNVYRSILLQNGNL